MNKFRAYDTFNNKMYYPDGNGYFFDEFSHDEFVIDGLGEPIFLSDMSTPEGMVLMRSVGISDDNDAEIYEDDILSVYVERFEGYGRLKFETDGEYLNGRVVYNPTQAQYEVVFGENNYSVVSIEFGWSTEKFEIIGNIHENPELL